MNEVMTRMDDTTNDFLTRNGWSNATLSEIEEKGASPRIYKRVHGTSGRTAIITFVDDPKMQITRFSEVAELLRGMGLSVPEIYAQDIPGKMLLQEDLGDNTFSRLIANGEDETKLHLLAVDVLAHIQKSFTAEDASNWSGKLLRYDFKEWSLGFANLEHFYRHYMPLVGAPELSSTEQQEFLGLWQKLLMPFEALSNTLLMRDFKPANMLIMQGRTGLQKVGLIDFQDAGLGSPLYDLVELTQSWRRDMPPEIGEAVLAAYGKARPELSADVIRSGCMAFGAVRWIIWIATCARYAHEGRPQFLANIPGVWRVAEQCLEDPALEELRRWFAHYTPAQLRMPKAAA